MEWSSTALFNEKEVQWVASAHKLVPFIFMEEQRLLQGSSDVGVGGNALEVGGRKLGELVVRQIFLFFFRQRWSFIEHLLLSLLTLRGFLQVLRVKTQQADSNTTNKRFIECEASEIGSS